MHIPKTLTIVNVLLCRVASRTLLIPFNTPTIGAGCRTDDEAFEELEELIDSNELSKCLGWMVGLGKELDSCREDVHTTGHYYYTL